MSPEPGRPSPRPLLVALTGGVASGKTAVSDRLAALGAAIVDTDRIAREVVEPGQPGLAELVDAFGEEILDENGTLDRQALGQRVFADPADRQRLESLLHPRIEARARSLVAQCAEAPYVVLVVPLLIESGLFDDADCVVVVDVPEEVQLQRLIKRSQMDETQARRMMAAQTTRERRLAAADQVIDNSGSLVDLDRQVRRLHNRLLQGG